MSDYDRKEFEDKIFCAKCGSLVEETLLLSCDHNLCIPCAAKNFSREEGKQIHKYKSVVCDLCLNVTPLDPSTANELSNISSHISSHETSRLAQNESFLNITSFSKSPGHHREYCKEHNEEVTYFCFDCQSRCICSECVVHGAHKSHEVMNVKRAYPLILEKTEDLLYGVQSRIGEINNVQLCLDSKKRELIESTGSLKSQLSAVFEEIRLRLQKKEKEIMDKAELFLQEHLQELNTYSRVLQTKIISLNKVIDGINSHASRKDEVGLVNFYSENKGKIVQTMESEIPDIPDFNTIYNLKVAVNQTSFDSLINSLNAVHMEISTTKGFEVNKIQNSQKWAVKRDIYGAKESDTVGNNSTKQFNLNQNLNKSINNLNSNLNRTQYKTTGNNLTNYANFVSSQNSSYDYSRNNLNVSFKSLTSHNEDSSDRFRSKLN